MLLDRGANAHIASRHGAFTPLEWAKDYPSLKSMFRLYDTYSQLVYENCDRDEVRNMSQGEIVTKGKEFYEDYVNEGRKALNSKIEKPATPVTDEQAFDYTRRQKKWHNSFLFKSYRSIKEFFISLFGGSTKKSAVKSKTPVEPLKKSLGNHLQKKPSKVALSSSFEASEKDKKTLEEDRRKNSTS